MSIRTHEQLFDQLNEEFAWRRKELSDIRALVELRQYSGSKRAALIRSGVALLYAHWEGYLKSSAAAYLEFVSMQKLKYKDLSLNFVILSARKIHRSASDSGKMQAHIALGQFYINDLDQRSNVPYKNVIDTESNLSSNVLREITNMLGLDYSSYETKKVLIDEQLLKARNCIAHGEFLQIDESDFIDLYDNVISLMNQFRNDIDNSVAQRKYEKRVNHETASRTS